MMIIIKGSSIILEITNIKLKHEAGGGKLRRKLESALNGIK